MDKRRLRTLILGTLVAGSLTMAGCRRDAGGTVNVVGSTSIQPFAELLKEAYQKQHPDRKVEVQGGGSEQGIQAAEKGLADIGTCSRSLTPDEASHFKEVVIARDGVAVVVHPSNPVKGLSTEQIRKVFSGAVTNWKEIGGKDSPILVITREEGSGTRESFVHLVMEKTAIARSALAQESNGAVKAMVKGDPAAIGYMSLGQVGTEVKALEIDGAAATDANVLAGKYKLARPFLLVTKGPPSPDAQAFIDFVLSPEGQKMLESEGLIRAK
jgi:phosphate transport system substrate-binding protein